MHSLDSGKSVHFESENASSKTNESEEPELKKRCSSPCESTNKIKNDNSNVEKCDMLEPKQFVKNKHHATKNIVESPKVISHNHCDANREKESSELKASVLSTSDGVQTKEDNSFCDKRKAVHILYNFKGSLASNSIGTIIT